MDLFLNDEHRRLKELYHAFAENEVRPIAHEIDEEERFPEETLSKLQKIGFMGIPYSKEYGGQGYDMTACVLCIEEMSKVCATTGGMISTHTLLAPGILLKYGTEAQKRKYLTPLLDGRFLSAFALTELNAGTDASGIQTKAVLQGNHYVLNGMKKFITGGGRADIYIVFAMTDESKKSRGISAFIIEKGFEGFRTGRMEKKMGLRASATCELIFDHCMIPGENLIGVEGEGFYIAMDAIDDGRIGIAAQALGIAEGAFEETVRYVKERKQFGKPLAAFQNTQFVLADIKTRIDAAKLLVYRAAAAKETQKKYSVEAATAKLFASETAMLVTTKCLQLFGGYGYLRDYPIERMMRDAKITEIYEGTSEVQRMVIAGSFLKANEGQS